MVGLQRLYHISYYVLRGILHHPCQDIDARAHSCNGDRKSRKLKLAGLASFAHIVWRSHDMEHVLLELIRVLVQTLCKLLDQLVVADGKVLESENY